MVSVLKFDDSYLNTIGKSTYQRKVRLRIMSFIDFINSQYPNVKDIFSVPQMTFEHYFSLINNIDAKRNSKIRYTSNLKSYFDWIRRNRNIPKHKLEIDLDDIFDNYHFSDTGKSRLETPFQKIHVFDCLRFFRERNFEDYILWGIIAFSSMRIGGAMNIQIKNINLDERYIITDEKQTECMGKDNIYFIPLKFKRSLESFLSEIQQVNSKREMLFKLTDKAYRLHLKDWGNSINERMSLKLDVHPHLFRDAFNTEIFELGANEEQRCMILNQMPRSVNPQHYLKRLRQIENRREIYDKFFPYNDFFRNN